MKIVKMDIDIETRTNLEFIAKKRGMTLRGILTVFIEQEQAALNIRNIRKERIKDER